MPKAIYDNIFLLIKSLTKAEKRNFKLYVNRLNNADDTKFIQVFNIIDKQNEYNEALILKKLKVTSAKLANVKNHLYKQLLISLRLTSSHNDIDINLREHIDYAKILYNKGLYKQSLKILRKIKSQCYKFRRHTILYDILNFERIIESQYITGGYESKATEIIKESNLIYSKLDNENKFANLSIELYGLYLKLGHIRNEKDLFMINNFIKNKLICENEQALNFNEKLYFFQAKGWYNIITNNFLEYYKYSRKWVDLFINYPDMKVCMPETYIKGLNNVLTSLFYANHYTYFIKYFNLLEEFITLKEIKFNTNVNVLYYLFSSVHKINIYYMRGTYSEGVKIVPEIEKNIALFDKNIDSHRKLVLYYKIACLYFGNGDYKNSIKYLNKVINTKSGTLRTDIHCFARILNLISHFEQKNHDYLDYQIKSTYRFLAKMNDLNKAQLLTLKFLRKLSFITPDQLKDNFKKLLQDMLALRNDRFEKRFFLYLDSISWLESKITNKPIQKVIQEKFKLDYK